MSATQQEYLVLSRGKWDKNASKDDIDRAIKTFYDWIERHVAAGRMKHGSRLSTHRAVVSKSGVLMDGPFGESKEIIGGYWFIVAGSLQEAAELAAENPCSQFGLHYEVRPLEPERASAYNLSNETPE
jgi:hypothetical protein